MALFGLHVPTFGPLHPIIGKLPNTGLSGFTQWRIPFGNATGGLTDDANFTYDGAGITLGNGSNALQEIIKIDNGTAVFPKVQYNSNFMGSGFAGWCWTLNTGAAASVSLSNDAESLLCAWSKALNKECSLILMNTTDLSDGSGWMFTKRADLDNRLVIEFGNYAAATSLEGLSISTAGAVTIPAMSSAGFVKNSAAGLLSGGNTIAVSDITDIATTYLKLDASNDPVTNTLQVNDRVDLGGTSEYIMKDSW